MNFRIWPVLGISIIVLACEPATEAPPATDETTPAASDALPVGEGTRENPYVGRGEVQEMGAGELVINHEFIPGWEMPPMPMAFPVIEDVALDELAVGDRVRFEIEMDGPVGYRIIGIEKIE